MIDEFRDVQGRLIISPKNKMTGRVSIIAIGSDEIPSSIIVKQHHNIMGDMFVYSDFVIVDPSYPPLLGNQRRASLNIPYRNDILGNIKISPRNKMTGIVEIVQKPKFKIKLYPIQDAFVRESIKTLNYGSEQTMLVGYNAALQERYRSVIKFDLDDLPDDITIIDAKLGVYNIKDEPLNHQIGLYTSSRDWEEYTVTWANQPDTDTLEDIQTLGRDIGYVEFDTSSAVKSWFYNEVDNNGFILKAMNESAPQFEQFHTRESNTNRPYLEITYEENVIYSYGRSDIESSLFVVAVGESEVKGSIRIPNFDEGFSLPSQIHVFNPNWWMEASITVNRREVQSNLIVKQYGTDDIPSNIVVRQRGIVDPEPIGHLTVNKPFIKGSIYVAYNDDIPSSIVIRKEGCERFPGKIVVNRRQITGRLRVARTERTDIFGSITVGKDELVDVNGHICVNRREIMGTIQVYLASHIPSSLTVVQEEYNDVEGNIIIPYRSDLPSSLDVVHSSVIPGSIQVLSGYLRASISIPAYEHNDKLGRLTVRVRMISEIPSSIFIHSDNLEGGYVFIL